LSVPLPFRRPATMFTNPSMGMNYFCASQSSLQSVDSRCGVGVGPSGPVMLQQEHFLLQRARMQQQQQYILMVQEAAAEQQQMIQIARFQQFELQQHYQRQRQYQQNQMAQYLAQQQQKQQSSKALASTGRVDGDGRQTMSLRPEEQQSKKRAQRRRERKVLKSRKSKQVTAADQKLASCLRWIILNDHIDDYAEMLCQSEHIRLLVINQCSKHSSTHSACIKWSKRWNLVQHPKCAKAVYHAMSQQSKPRKKQLFPKKENLIAGYHDLPHCTIDVAADVLFVDDDASFREARDVLLAERVSLGIDLEFMIRDFAITGAPKFCQILQIATTRKTVVFDLQAVPRKYPKSGGGRIDAEAFDNLVNVLFCSESVIKIGMSFDNDILLLTKQYPCFKCFKCIRNYLNLEKVLDFIRSDSGRATFGVDLAVERRIRNLKQREGGLPTVVRHVLKKRMEKKEQLSNWSLRPLRLSQLQYAAIDSAVEIEVYQKLLAICPHLISYRHFVADISPFVRDSHTSRARKFQPATKGLEGR